MTKATKTEIAATLALAAARAHARLVASELADDAAAPDVLHSARALAAFVLSLREVAP